MQNPVMGSFGNLPGKDNLLAVKKPSDNSSLADCDFQDHPMLVCNKDMDMLTLRQEIDAFQARHLQMASCSYFLRQGIDRLQVRHLQPASYLLYFAMEITTGKR